MELKKSYKGFVIWMICFFAVCIGLPFLTRYIADGDFMLRLVGNVCTLSVAVLAFIIYKTEYVYWYNGTSYEEAVKAGSERRKDFAWKHFKRFGGYALVMLVFSVIAHIFRINYCIDITILCVGLIATAISTISFKL